MRNYNEDEIVDFVNLTKHRPIDVRFIEYMPFSGNEWNTKKMVPYAEMKRIITEKYPEFKKLADEPNNTSKVSIIYCLIKKTNVIKILLLQFF